MSAAVEVDNLTRTFKTAQGPVVALDRVTLTIEAGEPVALLGENGAGKTTLTKILATLLYPSSGSARVFGQDVVAEAKAVRLLTTVVFGGDRGLYTMLSGIENLRYFGALNGLGRRELLSRIPGLLEQVGLDEAGRRPVQTYSKGMRQRLHLAVGLLTRTPLMLLDEPTVGLDPNEAERLREVIRTLAGDGTTVLLTSHNLLDVERLASRVIMIAKGHITHDLSLVEFRHLTGYEAIVTATLADANGVARTESVSVRRWSSDALFDLAQRFSADTLVDLQVRQSTLEEAFALASGKKP